MKSGTKVKVKLSNGNFHIGIYLGSDLHFKNTHFIGVLETSLNPSLKPKAGKKYISTFRAKIEQLSVLE